MGDVENMFQYLTEKLDELETLAVLHEDPSIVQQYALTLFQRIEAADKKSIYKELEASKHDTAKALQFVALCIHFPAVALRLMHFLQDPPKKGHRNPDHYKPYIYALVCALKVKTTNDDLDMNEVERFEKIWRNTGGSGREVTPPHAEGQDDLIGKKEIISKLKNVSHSDIDTVKRAFRTFNIEIDVLSDASCDSSVE